MLRCRFCRNTAVSRGGEVAGRACGIAQSHKRSKKRLRGHLEPHSSDQGGAGLWCKRGSIPCPQHNAAVQRMRKMTKDDNSFWVGRLGYAT